MQEMLLQIIIFIDLLRYFMKGEEVPNRVTSTIFLSTEWECFYFGLGEGHHFEWSYFEFILNAFFFLSKCVLNQYIRGILPQYCKHGNPPHLNICS